MPKNTDNNKATIVAETICPRCGGRACYVNMGWRCTSRCNLNAWQQCPGCGGLYGSYDPYCVRCLADR